MCDRHKGGFPCQGTPWSVIGQRPGSVEGSAGGRGRAGLLFHQPFSEYICQKCRSLKPLQKKNSVIQEIINDWFEAWNSHDLDRIMQHYAEEVEFTAQTVVTRWGKADGK